MIFDKHNIDTAVTLFNTLDMMWLDYETYYDDDCSLRKLSFQQYIDHPDFEVMLLSIADRNGELHVIHGPKAIRTFMLGVDWATKTVVAHNCAFEAYIFENYYGVSAHRYACTMHMAQPFAGRVIKSMALGSIAEFFSLDDKLDAISDMKGESYASLSPKKLHDYIDYCVHDTRLCYLIYHRLAELYSKIDIDEYAIIDNTIRMAAKPSFVLDEQLLKAASLDIHDRKNKMLDKVIDLGVVRNKTSIMSNAKLAEAYRALGVKVPMKTSPRTGKRTEAFSKGDKEFTELLRHKDKKVRALTEARLELKSTQEITRIDRFVGVSKERKDHATVVPLRYAKASTWRYAGDAGLNFQNLGRGSKLRTALTAPPGYVVAAGDFSQIEARLVAYYAGQTNLLERFEAGEDVYSWFASKYIYSKPINKNDHAEERFVGKSGILSLGYQSGAERFKEFLRVVGDTDIPLDECTRVVNIYRKEAFPEIPRLWYALQDTIRVWVTAKQPFEFKQWAFGRVRDFYPMRARIISKDLENFYNAHAVKTEFGHLLLFPNLRYNMENEIVYDKPVTGATKLYGGSLLESLCQHAARNLVSVAQAALHNKGVWVVNQVHDELVMLIEKEKIDRTTGVLEKLFSYCPPQFKGLPVTGEVAHGNDYGDCK